MPSEMHPIIGKLAWNCLSEADKQAWGLAPEMPECAPDWMRHWETHSVEEKMAHYSVFGDYMGYAAEVLARTPQYLLPGGIVTPHGAVTGRLTSVGNDDQLFDVWGWRTVLRTFVPRMMEAAYAGKMEEAALFGGLLAHFLEDGACLGHTVPAALLYDMMPEGPETEHRDLHAPFDDATPELEPVTPQLLGTSVPEVVFRLSQMGERNYRESLGVLIPSLQACATRDMETLTELSRPMFQSALLQLASLWHTVVVLAKDTVPAEEAEALRELDLTEAEGHLVHPGSTYRLVIPKNYSIESGQYVPLRADLGNGPQDIDPGLGMTSFHSIRYLLEPGAFDRVEGQVVLSSDYLRDQEEGMLVEFFVALADEWEQTVDSDLCYPPALRKVFSCALKPGQPPQAFSVELGDAQTLMFAIKPEVIRFEKGFKCWYPHVALVGPRLVKA